MSLLTWTLYVFDYPPALLAEEPEPVWDEPDDVPPLVLAEWRAITGDPDAAECRTCPPHPACTVIGWCLNDEPEDGPTGMHWRSFTVITDGQAAWAVCEDCAGQPVGAATQEDA